MVCFTVPRSHIAVDYMDILLGRKWDFQLIVSYGSIADLAHHLNEIVSIVTNIDSCHLSVQLKQLYA